MSSTAVAVSLLELWIIVELSRTEMVITNAVTVSLLKLTVVVEWSCMGIVPAPAVATPPVSL